MPTILQLADQLATAEAAFARQQNDQPRKGPALVRAEPGCAKACPTCWLECAIIFGCVEETRRRLEKAMGETAPALSHGGKFYVAAIGNA